mgnify:CR=1 FL=1
MPKQKSKKNTKKTSKSELIFIKPKKKPTTQKQSISNMTIIPKGTVMYHGRYSDFDTHPFDSIHDRSNYAAIPFKVCMRWAGCYKSNIKYPIIYKYVSNKPLQLIDIDKAGNSSAKQIKEMHRIIDNLSGYDTGNTGNQDILKTLLCKNGYDGYKWLKHEDEYVVCHSKHLTRVHDIPCLTALQSKPAKTVKEQARKQNDIQSLIQKRAQANKSIY